MSLVTTLHNFLYADRQGNIAYFGDGLVPIEPSSATSTRGCPRWATAPSSGQGFVPFAQMPHSVNPAQGYLDNWNTKPSQQAYYQQNGGDEYWGTIFRSPLISQLAGASTHITVGYLEGIEHAIGTIDNGDNTRPGRAVLHPVPGPRLPAAAEPATARWPARRPTRTWPGDRARWRTGTASARWAARPCRSS